MAVIRISYFKDDQAAIMGGGIDAFSRKPDAWAEQIIEDFIFANCDDPLDAVDMAGDSATRRLVREMRKAPHLLPKSARPAATTEENAERSPSTFSKEKSDYIDATLKRDGIKDGWE